MPDDDSTLQIRKDQRFQVSWSVRLQTKDFDETHPGRTVNLSKTGAFICTGHHVKPSTLVQLTFTHPDLGEVVVFAEVVRVVAADEAAERQVEAGLGVAFMNPRKTVRDFLDSVLDEIDKDTTDELLSTPAPTWSEADGPPPGEGDPEIMYAKAETEFEQGEASRAADLARIISDKDPENSKYKLLFHLASAAAFMADNEQDNAVIHWEAARRIEPDNQTAIQGLREAGASHQQQQGIMGRFLGKLRGS